MIRVYVLCEGQTEESFVKKLLCDMFFSKGIALIPIICETKRERSGLKHKGGVSTYGKIRKELVALCKSHPSEYVTMMFDYYALPHDTPSFDNMPAGSAYDKVAYLENAIFQDIDTSNFLPNIILYEFEGLLFSSPDAFSYCGLPESAVVELRNVRDFFVTPESINDGVDTAPSKRIMSIHPSYNKLVDGVNIARSIGIDKIMSECVHFCSWIERIAKLSNGWRAKS